MATLKVIAPGEPPTEHALDASPFTVGRDPAASLTLDYGFISRRHVVLTRRGDRWALEAHGKNPVSVDGRPVSSLQLSSGARVQLGPVTLLFEEDTVSRPARIAGDLPTLELSREQLVASVRPELLQLSDISMQLAAATSREDVVDIVCQALREIFRADGAEVWVDGHRIGAAGSVEREPRVRTAVEAAASQDGAAAFPGVLAAAFERGKTAVVAVRKLRPFDASEAAFLTVLAQLTGAALVASRRTEKITQKAEALAREVADKGGFGQLIGSSLPMQTLARSIAKVAPTTTTVLITGETGSGKELVAREVHARSGRRGGFVAVNCAALPEQLVESELFGHRRGAFSGADRDRDGLFTVADGGTLLLDEVGELPLAAQAKLLRVLESQEVLPLGAGEPHTVDARVVAATHRDLAAAVRARTFREDLFFRLRVFPLSVPPLRDRMSDVPALVAALLERSSTARQKQLGPATDAFLEALATHDFPGNVRELAHVVEHAVVMADEGDPLDVMHLSLEIGAPTSTAPVAGIDRPLREVVAEFERLTIVAQLEKDGWNRTQAAKNLGMSLRGFMQKLKRHGIKGPAPSR